MAILFLLLTTVLVYGVQGFQLAVVQPSATTTTVRTRTSFLFMSSAVALGPNNTTSGISGAADSHVVIAPVRPPMSERMEAASLMLDKEAMAEALEAAYTMASSSLLSDEEAPTIVVERPTRDTLVKPVHSFETMWDCLEFLQHLQDIDYDNEHPQQEEFLKHLEEDEQVEQQEFYVVKYYAQYCKVCQRAAINYKKISLEHARSRVHFLRADAGSWATGGYLTELKELGISKFPFVQIYDKQGQCVASFSTGAAHLFTKRVRDTLELILQRTPEEWQAFEHDFGLEMADNQRVRRQLLDARNLPPPRP